MLIAESKIYVLCSGGAKDAQNSRESLMGRSLMILPTKKSCRVNLSIIKCKQKHIHTMLHGVSATINLRSHMLDLFYIMIGVCVCVWFQKQYLHTISAPGLNVLVVLSRRT